MMKLQSTLAFIIATEEAPATHFIQCDFADFLSPFDHRFNQILGTIGVFSLVSHACIIPNIDRTRKVLQPLALPLSYSRIKFLRNCLRFYLFTKKRSRFAKRKGARLRAPWSGQMAERVLGFEPPFALWTYPINDRAWE